MIALIGSKKELHIKYLNTLFQDKGVEPFLLDAEDFPHGWTLSLQDGQLRVNHCDLEIPQVVYVRQLYLSPIMSDPVVESWMNTNWYATLMAFSEKSALLISALKIMEDRGAYFINPVTRSSPHGMKPYQLTALRAAGLPVPATLITNNPDEVRAFVQAHGVVIYKPVSGGAHTKLIESKDLTDERLALLSNAPAIFQPFIPGTNLRVYVLGDRVISAGVIDSEKIDFREDQQPIQETAIDSSISEACLKAARVGELAFTAIDLRWDKGRSFTFLECNSSPMFIGWDRQVERKVGPALVEFMCHKAQGRRSAGE